MAAISVIILQFFLTETEGKPPSSSPTCNQHLSNWLKSALVHQIGNIKKLKID